MVHQEHIILLYGPDCDGLVSMMQQSATSSCPMSSWLRSKSRLLLLYTRKSLDDLMFLHESFISD